MELNPVAVDERLARLSCTVKVCQRVLALVVIFFVDIFLLRVVVHVDAAQKEKPFARRPQPQKVLVVELLLLPYPVCRVLHIEHRVDDCTGPYRRVTYSPFRAEILQLIMSLSHWSPQTITN